MFNFYDANAGAYRTPQGGPPPQIGGQGVESLLGTTGNGWSPQQQGYAPGQIPWYGQMNWMTGNAWAPAPYQSMPNQTQRIDHSGYKDPAAGGGGAAAGGWGSGGFTRERNADWDVGNFNNPNQMYTYYDVATGQRVRPGQLDDAQRAQFNTYHQNRWDTTLDQQRMADRHWVMNQSSFAGQGE